MQNQFRRFLRGSVYHSEDCRTGGQKSLKTRAEAEARQLIQANNTAANHPAFNRAMAKSYLAIADPKMETRTWGEVMKRFCDRENPATRARHERVVKSKSMRFLRDKPLLDTTAGDLFSKPSVLEQKARCGSFEHCITMPTVSVGRGQIRQRALFTENAKIA